MWTYVNTKDNIRVESEFLDDVLAAYRAQKTKSNVEKESSSDAYYWATKPHDWMFQESSRLFFLVRKVDGKIVLKMESYLDGETFRLSGPDGKLLGDFIDADSAMKYAEKWLVGHFDQDAV
jgi:hypothetical protein